MGEGVVDILFWLVFNGDEVVDIVVWVVVCLGIGIILIDVVIVNLFFYVV